MARSFSDISQALRSGELTIVQLVEEYIAAIDRSAHLNIYVEVFAEKALQRARELDDKRQQAPDQCGQLHGMVISIKDVICYAGHKVSASSRMLEGFESQITATVLQRALDEDAIVIGRTNCDEFAMGSANQNSHYGPTKNGADESRVPGGSSGAAAVSVQMDTCLLALGSDTGGSVRQPAAFCGVYGMKPTYGRLSRYGLIAYASSFDQIGLLSKDINSIKLGLSVMEGHDPMDATSMDPIESDAPSDKLTIAYIEEIMDHPALAPSVKLALEDKMKELEAKGHKLVPVSFDLLDYLVPCYYVLTTAEASSNLNRYDGLRYGYRAEDTSDINDLYISTRSEGFGIEVKRRIMMGTFVMSVGYFDAYFQKAQQIRTLLKRKIDGIFDQADVLLMPTTPDIAWQIGSNDQDPLADYLADVFTVLANLCGIPAISIPAGADQETDMPIGLQLLSQREGDDVLLAV